MKKNVNSSFLFHFVFQFGLFLVLELFNTVRFLCLFFLAMKILSNWLFNFGDSHNILLKCPRGNSISVCIFFYSSAPLLCAQDVEFITFYFQMNQNLTKIL